MKIESWVNKTKITVIDDIMGSGKTTWAIQYMNQAPKEQKFLYITPFLKEVQRIQKATIHVRKLVEPSEKNRSKLNDLKSLLDNGESIITTHALFKNFDDEVLKLLKMHHYTLIMDEVAEVVEVVKMTDSDIKILKSSGLIEVDESSRVTWIAPDYTGKFEALKLLIKTDKVYLQNDTSFIWTFPVEVFQVFRQVYVLTYLFDGSLMKNYFNLHGVSYIQKSIGIKDPECNLPIIMKDGGIDYGLISLYGLIDFRKPELSQISEFIEIVEDSKLNAIGEPINKRGHDALTFTKLERLRKDSTVAKKLENNMANFIRNRCKAKAQDVMWTAPKALMEKRVIGNGSRKSFVASNARATNEYRDRTVCVYLLNKFMNPSVKGFFTSQGIEVDEDLYAVSELVQWLFRSGIRDGKKIQLYIPSKRMRNLLKGWLNG